MDIERYTLYIANRNYSSWSLRPWVLMRELGIPFTEKLVPFGAKSNWDAFRTFSPNGRVPCLHADDVRIWDSLAITEFLAERHPGVWPAQTRERAWARSAAAEMHSGLEALRSQCPMHCGFRIRLHDVPEDMQKDLDRIDELWTEGLERSGGPFLTGNRFTAVDAFFAPVAFRIQTYCLVLSDNAARYASHLLSLSAMQSWYADALAEPWRQADHEQEPLNHGILLEDLRTPS